jgi:hypothetical protein
MGPLTQMAVTPDRGKARQQLEAAVALAQRPDELLPAEWLERTRRVGQSPNRTFVAALGTGLLAKATDGRVDPLALKEDAGERAYSARGLCHAILVPAAGEFGFHLGATGREPLNNQPFFRYDRIDAIQRVKSRAALEALGYLIECLRRVDELDEDAALLGLAAFVRVRMQVAAAVQRLPLAEVGLGVEELLAATAGFLAEDAEYGRRGQAFVAAVFDLVFDEVRSGRVHDPSVRAPGDVRALHRGRVVVAAEVRQKPVPATEVLQFAGRLQAAGIRRGVVAALAPEQPRIDVAGLRRVAWERHEVLMTILAGPAAVLLGALAWSTRSLAECLAEFPAKMLERLEEQEVSDAGQRGWAALVAATVAAEDATSARQGELLAEEDGGRPADRGD